jgi:predicted chitinase
MAALLGLWRRVLAAGEIAMPIDFLVMRGATGPQAQRLKAALVEQLGANARSFAGLSSAGPVFDADCEAALRHWQANCGLVADGIAGPHCLQVLGLRAQVPLEFAPDLATARALFPQTKPSNIARYLPYVTDALEAAGLTDRTMILAALATLRAETAGFIPISEYPSRYNTLPGQAPFSAYEPGTSAGEALGNGEPGDGAKYRGRGFVQLTGASNYALYTIATGVDLVGQPELANAPEVASVLLAVFLAQRADAMRSLLARGRYAQARKLVNGGTHGLEEFTSVFERADDIARTARKSEEPAEPAQASRRRAGRGVAAQQAQRVRRKRDARKDPVDLRDRLYAPPPMVLPEQWPSAGDVQANLEHYRHLVLDQGEDASCTGYGLACVINFSRWQKSGWRTGIESVSARMLYTLARRYDEYAGENYEGSSCRGALKGWSHHGVCLLRDWPDGGRPKYGYAERALKTTLGVYYRIDRRSITDMQAAIVQAHAIYVSAFTHDGWPALDHERASTKAPTHANLPAVAFDGRASRRDGHAFALVGFDSRGFIVQNSWGARWGLGGFAILTYADWLANGMDAWVASLGVPGVVQGRLAEAAKHAGRAGVDAGADESKWWDEARAYEHSIVIGNDGRVSRYLTQDELTRTLLYQACTLPDQWFRTDGASSKRKRLVIYAHGGLNSEQEAIARARAMGRYFTGNACYPVFLVWKTGILESMADVVEDAMRRPPRAGGIAGKLLDATDTLIERTLGRGPARTIWSEIKENAKFACDTSRAGDHLAAALQNLSTTWGDRLEIHLVGHSAGSIILGHLLEILSARGLKPVVASAHLFAPACTVQFANRYYAPHADLMARLWMHILSDERERDDSVAAIYRKSLLYLVSNALEPDLRTPLLGMENVLKPSYAGWDGSSTTAEALGSWRDAMQASGLDQRIAVIRSPRVHEWKQPSGTVATTQATHGSFDNNLDVLAATLERITGGALPMPVDDLRGF